MKKILLSIVILLSMTIMSKADGLAIHNVLVQKGGAATIEVALNNTDASYRAVLFDLTLPDGINVIYDEYGDTQLTKGSRLSAKYSVTANHLEGESDRFGLINTTDDEVIAGEDGTLFSFTIVASGGLIPGTVLTANVSAIKLTDADATDHEQEAFTFNITVEEIRTILDEASTTMPEACEDPVDVRLNRTIKANEWSTIVLPFTATGEQVKAAFGEDVALATFTAWESEEDNEGAIVGINVTFTDANIDSGIEANVPMLIRVSDDVTTATFDKVTIEPDDAPEVRVGKTSKTRGYFYGTYIATKVPAENLFLSGSNFWYSTGKTNIKGYRGYFDFRDVLDAYYDASQVKMNFFVGGIETHINDILPVTAAEETMYDLSGRRSVKASQRGIYIVNGKKVVVNNKH